MSGIFLSHSSVDKRFVRRMALDLLQRDVPVWFDEWQLDVGAKLSDRINSGILDSPFFLVVLSRASAQSTWVEREIAWALDRETATGRDILLPIRIDDCDIPVTLADRLYADFSAGYLTALESLAKNLRRRGVVSHEALAPQRELIPVFFHHGTRLNRLQLQQRLAKLLPRLPDDYLVSADQFRLTADDQYDELRRRMFHRMENLADDPYYSTEFEDDFTGTFQMVLRLEDQLLDGLARIINKRRNLWDDGSAVAMACHWYARMKRAELLGWMNMTQRPDLPSIDYGADCFVNYCMNSDRDAWLHEVAGTERINVGRGTDGRLDWSGRINIDANSTLASRMKPPMLPIELAYDMSRMEIAEWVVPQLVTYRPEIDDWDFDNYVAATD
jgi:hypothetical protein